ncbi:alpha/beta fold hydrolase [Haloferax namakaokahaiae]|uniref:Alpha/beta fold hydrolase n=1 Tax=Haloferax namakaokahaiae TaxID=1748331 RepID=A0ABD5ZEB7_9EURY
MATRWRSDTETVARSPYGPTAAFERARDVLLEDAGLDAQSRFVELERPRVRVHVLDTGPTNPPSDDAAPPDDDVPLVFVHGTAEFGAFLAPLMGQYENTRMLTFDRPGYGSSDGFVYTASNVRQTVVSTLEGVLDEMGIERADLVGHSMGGHASILFAGSHPERVRRLFLVGAVPGFPGTSPPLAFRLLATPLLGSVIRRFQKSGEAGVYDVAAVFGEADAIERHPAFVRAIAAHEADPKSALAGRSEFDALIGVRGWRQGRCIRDAELRSVERPTTVIWGDHDPLGTPDEVRRFVELLPDVRFETVDAGHIPYLSHPERCAELVRKERST